MKEQILAYLKTQGNAKSATEIARYLFEGTKNAKVGKLLKELTAEKETRALNIGAKTFYKHKDN